MLSNSKIKKGFLERNYFLFVLEVESLSFILNKFSVEQLVQGPTKHTNHLVVTELR